MLSSRSENEAQDLNAFLDENKGLINEANNILAQSLEGIEGAVILW
ncbi:hypothetical protein GCM10008014_10470 [Paenibacillus silvae]|uniref:Uncharacterized protein n=1 Tax=Paenibacillus silvae TaxID=1325358 RepID=A0ABQ1Z2G5_9BACL|nr:hypothetical protein GCM10008014_10470 [Paenibacillus silvae]